MLPSCREVSQLASENLDTPVKGNRWLKMKLHLLMCTYCRRYNKQISLAQKTVCQLGHNQEQSDEVKEQIFKNVEANYQETHKAK